MKGGPRYFLNSTKMIQWPWRSVVWETEDLQNVIIWNINYIMRLLVYQSESFIGEWRQKRMVRSLIAFRKLGLYLKMSSVLRFVVSRPIHTNIQSGLQSYRALSSPIYYPSSTSRVRHFRLQRTAEINFHTEKLCRGLNLVSSRRSHPYQASSFSTVVMMVRPFSEPQ